MTTYVTYYDSCVGRLTIASDGENITGLWIENQKYYGYKQLDNAVREDGLKIFKKTKNWLDAYFNKENPDISKLSLKTVGTPFRQEVWKILETIPYGTTTTYANIASIIAEHRNIDKMSSQAVGGAVGHNPISIIIPCHRVVGKNGSLTGYAGGINNKIKLLELEGVDVSKFSLP